MKSYINNSFSLNMLKLNKKHNIEVIAVSVIEEDMAYDETGHDIFNFADSISVWGHADSVETVNNLFPILKGKIAYNRQNLTLEKGDRMLVIQRVGERLPESSIIAIDPSGFQWAMVIVVII